MEYLIGIGSTILGGIANVTVEPVCRQLRYLFRYQRNINDLKKKIQDLNAKKTSIEHQVEQAHVRGEEAEEIFKKWLNEVEQCSKVAEDILRHEDHMAECLCTGSFPNLALRWKLSRKAKKTVEVIASEIEKVPDNISHIPNLKSSFENGGFVEFGTRTLALKEIMEALKDLNIRKIGVYGTAGVRKTTLVKEVARRARQEELFTEVVMVTVPQSFDHQNIEKDIARQLRMQFEESKSKLIQYPGKKDMGPLIILDGIWKKLKLEDIGTYFDKDNQDQCKMLLVSRNRYVLRDDLGIEKDIKVDVLSESEAMNLFHKVVRVERKESDFRYLASAIVEKCGYLPVAIKSIAYALKDRDISSWRAALDNMTSSTEDNAAYLSTKTSYDFLSEEGKMILLLCAQHRQVENISVEDLVNIFVAICDMFLEVDALQDARKMETLQDARKEVHTLVEKLKGYGLLLDGDKDGSVKLHDVIREKMVLIAMEDKSMYCFGNFISLKHTLLNGKSNPAGISLLGDDFNQFPDSLPCSKLKLLLMHQGIYESLYFRPILFPRAFLEEAKELRAFCLRSIIVQPLPLSPYCLPNLQTLSLKNCILRDVAFIGELENLVVLDLSNSKFELLPEQIGKLTCLRQLNLNNCSDLKVIQPNVISNLVRLEELYMDNVYVDWVVETVDGERRNILVEVKNLPRLSALHLYILDACALQNDMFVDGKLKRFNIIVGRVEFFQLKTSSRLLYLNLHESSHLYEHGFQILMKESEVLYLDTLPGVTHGVPLFEEKVAFPNQLPASSPMLNLTRLNVTSCMNLKHLFTSAIVGSLTQLEDLVISKCPVMEEIIAIEEGTSSQKILFPKLTSLKLDRLESLKTFCGGDCKVVSKNLQELEITECNSLLSLGDFITSECLHQLTKLSIWYCNLMEEVLVLKNADDEERKYKISFPKLQDLSLVDLPNLKRLSSCEADYTIEFPSLLKIYTRKCPELRTFIGKSTRPSSSIETQVEEIGLNGEVAISKIMLDGITFENLQVLTIWMCHNLQYLLPFETVESLKHLKVLRVYDCSCMEQIITKAVGEDGRLKNISFPKLKSIKLHNLPKLKRFCEGNRIECPSLLNLKIWKCFEFRTFIPCSASVEENELVAQQPLLNKKVVLANLEELSVFGWGKDVNELWPHQFSTTLFPNLKVLQLGRPIGFFLSKILRFKNLETIDLWGCLEENIWQHEEHGQTLAHLRSLELGQLPKLKHLFEDPAENMQLVHQTVPNLETLVVRKCDSLKTLVMSSSHFSFENLAVLELSECHDLVNLFDSSTAKSLVRLKTMSITECNQLIHVIHDENKMQEELAKTEIIFSRLETLTLAFLPGLKSFYGGNNKLEFPKLEKIIVEECPKMKTFSRGMSVHSPNLKMTTGLYTEEYLEGDLNGSIRKLWESQDDSFATVVSKNLQELEITGCNSLLSPRDFITSESLHQLTKLSIQRCNFMGEVLVLKEAKDEERKSKKISFPKLQDLTLVELPNLKRFLFCEADYTIEFPSLLKLDISSCDELRTFIAQSPRPTSSIENQDEEIQFNREVALSKIMLSRTTFGNLQFLTIWMCHNLQYLLPFESIESLKHLKVLCVCDCKVMEQIITKATGGEDGRFKNISFPKLESIELDDLPKLKSFCKGDRIECPSLLKLEIYDCHKFRTFIPNSASVEENELVVRQPLFNEKVVLTNLEELHVSDWEKGVNELWPHQFSMVLFPKLKVLQLERPSGFLLYKILKFKNLETIDLRGCLEENIWQREEHGQTLSHLRTLALKELPKLMHLFKDPAENMQLVHQTVPNLETLVVRKCDSLKTLVMSSSHFSFENLAVLELSECHGLVNFFDSSTARTLVQLKTICITECNQLIQVIHDMNEMEDELAKTEIIFSRLETLTLAFLPSLKSFYGGNNKLEFPELEKITVEKCPEMRTFSHGISINSPNLRIITIGHHTEEYLESDLNARIRKLWESQDDSFTKVEKGQEETPISPTVDPAPESEKEVTTTPALEEQVQTPVAKKKKKKPKSTPKEQVKTSKVEKEPIKEDQDEETLYTEASPMTVEDASPTKSISGAKGFSSSGKRKRVKKTAPTGKRRRQRWQEAPSSDKKEEGKGEEALAEKTLEVRKDRDATDEEINETIYRFLLAEKLESPLKQTGAPSSTQKQKAEDEETSPWEEGNTKNDTEEDMEWVPEADFLPTDEVGTEEIDAGRVAKIREKNPSIEEKGKAEAVGTSSSPPSWYNEAGYQLMEKFNKAHHSSIEAESLFSLSGDQAMIRDVSVPIELVALLSQVLDKHPNVAPKEMSSRLCSYAYTRLGYVLLGLDTLTIENVTHEAILAWRDVCIELIQLGCDVTFLITHLERIVMQTLQDHYKDAGRAEMRLQIPKMEAELIRLRKEYEDLDGEARGPERSSLFSGLL